MLTFVETKTRLSNTKITDINFKKDNSFERMFGGECVNRKTKMHSLKDNEVSSTKNQF